MIIHQRSSIGSICSKKRSLILLTNLRYSFYIPWCSRIPVGLYITGHIYITGHYLMPVENPCPVWLTSSRNVKLGAPDSKVHGTYMGPTWGRQVITRTNVDLREPILSTFLFVVCINVQSPSSRVRLVYAYTVYPMKYAHGFCLIVLCCGYTLTDFPIFIRLTSLALWQSNDCPSASKATLMNMDKYFMWIHYERLHNHNKAKHNKTVCIFIGIYCKYV